MYVRPKLMDSAEYGGAKKQVSFSRQWDGGGKEYNNIFIKYWYSTDKPYDSGQGKERN